LFGLLLGAGRNAISNPGVDWFWPLKMVNNLHEPSWTNWFWHGELSKPTIDLSSACQFWVELIDLTVDHLAKTLGRSRDQIFGRLHSSSSSAIWVHEVYLSFSDWPLENHQRTNHTLWNDVNFIPNKNVFSDTRSMASRACHATSLVDGAITIFKNMSSSMGRMTSHVWNG
jgi:hypothetical protein